MNLKRQVLEIYYYKDKHECDFLIKKELKIVSAIQVCYELNNENKKREIDGLLEAMNEHKLEEGLIITFEQEEKLEIKNKKITIIPACKWLLKKRLRKTKKN